MKKYFQTLHFLLLISALFLQSCESIVDEVDINKFGSLKEKVVVTSFISPRDREITVKLNKTIPLYGILSGKFEKIFDPATGDSVLFYRSDDYIKDAIVSIKSGQTSARLNFNEKNLSYTLSTSEFPILAGKEYNLEVIWNKEIIKAKTTVPLDQVNIEDLVIKEFEERRSSFLGTDTLKGIKVDFSFKDIPGKENYYKVWGELNYMVNYPNFKNGFVIYLPKKFFSYLFWPDDERTGIDRYQTDKGRDGQRLKSIAGEIRRRDVFNCPGDRSFETKGCVKAQDLPNEPRILEVQLWNMSKELYDYQISLRVFNETSNNPFAEPIPVYSNVSGGLGIFAGYNASSQIRRL